MRARQRVPVKRRLHWVCGGLIALFLLTMWAGLAHQGPVPLRADDDTLAVATTAIALAGVSAAAVWLLLPDWQDRLIAGVMAWVLVMILTPTALTDLLHAANALRVEAGSRQQSVERFAALKEANPAKRRSAYWLRSLPTHLQDGQAQLQDRRLSRAAHAALQSERLIPGELLQIEEATGALGWPFVVRVTRLRAPTEFAFQAQPARAQ